MSRRRQGTLLPLELEILDTALSLLRAGEGTFHGFGLAQTMRAERGSRSLTAHGTLYKALGRLEDLELLRSRWDDPEASAGRPRRRLYQLTIDGTRVAEAARAEAAVGPKLRAAGEPA